MKICQEKVWPQGLNTYGFDSLFQLGYSEEEGPRWVKVDKIEKTENEFNFTAEILTQMENALEETGAPENAILILKEMKEEAKKEKNDNSNET
jgi:hypothetical protein